MVNEIKANFSRIRFFSSRVMVYGFVATYKSIMSFFLYIGGCSFYGSRLSAQLSMAILIHFISELEVDLFRKNFMRCRYAFSCVNICSTNVNLVIRKQH